MKVIDRQAAQGDVLFTRIDALPEGVKAVKAEENGEHIVTHSETGHHHVMDSEHVNLFEAANDPFVMYLVVDEPTNLRHLRDVDTHETINFPPGTYRVNRQREMSGSEIVFALD